MTLIGVFDFIWANSPPDFVAAEILRFRDMLEAEGVPAWLAPYHYAYTDRGKLDPDNWMIVEMNQRVRRETPAADWLVGFDKKMRWPEHYIDAIHINAAGQQIKADLAFKKMKKQKLLGRCE
jgi:hypothetical protein